MRKQIPHKKGMHCCMLLLHQSSLTFWQVSLNLQFYYFIYSVRQRGTYQVHNTQRLVRFLIDIRKYSTSRTYSSNTKLRVILQNPR